MIKQDCILGFDISSKTIGVTVMNMSGKLLDISFISMPKKSKKNGNVTYYKKMDHFKDYMKKYSIYNVKHIFIEEPLKNGPNINTVIVLAIFNGMISNKLYELYNVEPEHISVHEARSFFFPEYVQKRKVKGEVKYILSFPKDADKKKLVFNKVSYSEPQIIWEWSKNFLFKEENYDMSDSYVVAKAGLLKNNYIST